MEEIVLCKYCGAQFLVHEPKCPFCGNTFVPAAEEDFLDDMHDMADELHALASEDIKTADAVRDDVDDAVFAPRDIPQDPQYYGRQSESVFTGAHDENMESFRASFQTAQTNVHKTVQKHRRIERKTVIVVALLLLLVILAFLNTNAFSVWYRHTRRSINRNEAAYSAEIDRLLVEEDFLTLTAFIKKRHIRWNSGLREDHYASYRQIFLYCEEYAAVIENVRAIAYDYNADDYRYSRIASALHSFYYFSDDNYAPADTADKEKTDAAFAAMEEEIHTLLRYYLKVTDEDLDRLSTLNETQMKALFRRYYEANTGDSAE